MVRSEARLTVALLLLAASCNLLAASCNRHPDEDRAKTAAAQRSAHERSDLARNETMDMAGAPRNEAGAPHGPRKEGESP